MSNRRAITGPYCQTVDGNVRHPIPSAATKAAGAGALARAGLPPRGLDRLQAAAYVGISPTLFDIMVQDGRMPPAKRIGTRRVWDVRALDRAFDALPSDGDDTGGEAGDVWGQARA